MPSHTARDQTVPTDTRLILTLGVPLVVWLLSGASAPVEFPYRHVLVEYPIGLGPVVTAFLLVELLAAVVPQWRALRIAGPAQRAKLTRAAWTLSAVLIAFDLLDVMVRYTGSLTSWSMTLVIMLGVNVGWTLTLVVLARWVGRVGLVNGYALLLAFEWVPHPFLTESPRGTMFALVAMFGLMAVTAALLESRRATQTHGDLTLHAPLSGITPLVAVGAMLGFPHGRWAGVAYYLPLDALRELYPGSPAGILVSLVLVAVFTYAFAHLFNRRAFLLSLVPDGAGAIVSQRFDTALSHTMLFTLCLTLGTRLLEASSFLPLASATVPAACFAALLLDARDEYRAREKLGHLVPVWSEQRAYALGPLSAALTHAGIPHHVRGARIRTLLLHVPLVPAELLVAPKQVDAALAVLKARNAESVALVQGHAPSTF